LSTKVTPVGSAPVSERAGFGLPEDVTVKVPAVLMVKVTELPLVIAGA